MNAPRMNELWTRGARMSGARPPGLARHFAVTGLILTVALIRIVPHPMNFTPVGAMALLGGASFGRHRTAFLVPLGAMLLGDLSLGWISGDMGMAFHPLMPAVYGSFALIVCLGSLLRGRIRVLTVGGASLAASLLFFALTNLANWAVFTTYPKTWEGLVACYVVALPYLGNTIAGDAFYAAVLFGTLALAERAFPAVREEDRAGPSRAPA